MAEGGYERLPNNDDDFPDNDDDNADQTTPFFPKGVSTPYQSHFREEMEMKEIHKKSGRPETSYAETSFGGDEDLDRKLAILRRDALTGMINTTNIPDVYRLDPEQQEKEIKRVKDFIKTRYPNADLSKLVIGFSSEKPMDIVIKGPKGGETKIIKDNGSDFEKNFLNLTYVKRALGESYEEFAKKQEQRIYEERKMLTEVVRKSPEKREIIDSLKEKILKKETEKKKKKESFMKRNKQKKSKSEKRKLKNKMKKMKKS